MVLKEEHLPLAITHSANGVLGSRESEETGSNGNNNGGGGATETRNTQFRGKKKKLVINHEGNMGSWQCEDFSLNLYFRTCVTDGLDLPAIKSVFDAG